VALPEPIAVHDDHYGRLRFRTVWISDLHLGSTACQAELLLDFLRHTESTHLYLVGDIVDGWRLRRRWFWPQAHNDVVQKVLRKARKGTAVVYIPGNHDAFGRHFGAISAWLLPVGGGDRPDQLRHAPAVEACQGSGQRGRARCAYGAARDLASAGGTGLAPASRFLMRLGTPVGPDILRWLRGWHRRREQLAAQRAAEQPNRRPREVHRPMALE